MAVSIKTKYGNIAVSNEVIASIVGVAATDIYGIVGMASKSQIRDGMNMILNRDNYTRGVVVRQEGDDTVVDVYIIVGYGVKISEVCRNVQNRVKYNLETMLGAPTAKVNVIVQGVKILEAD
ncbi:Asp23/Gls24 family envelope stress response protein [Bombilactobacillus thymidiniphilus]|uniref:Asp23/Gls24 family envelope stress response protein n=1 Tax=Bombilactobacillus thymidiniphilus TaxID=2923363 RepID=A0ABY4PCH9_9LACO|nr:Asp23/Gls24 family envelope stress response protein [Bombilactobacillus thymidiniphilus]UQS83465.1 Asp23/Gls24 family envelope stress response protein [Bombilactobacillus thymidiniphilus]